jgi:predicted  nucleic acid-binding Zn-ribbon protein
MRTLSETLDRRTFQLGESEVKLAEARKSRDEAVDALDRRRHGHGVTRTKMDEDMSQLRRKVEELKDQLSESRRERNVEGGRLESLAREVEELRSELKDKNKRLSAYDNQIGAGRDDVHFMTTRVAELEGLLSSLQHSSSEQGTRDGDVIVSLRRDLKDEGTKSDRLASSLKEIEAEKQGMQRNVESLESQINTLESALTRYRSSESASVPSTSLAVAVTGQSAGGGGASADEVARFQQQLDAKDHIIQKKEEEIAALKNILKDLEGEVARRTLRAAGMAANKITEEKKRMQEQSAVQSRQMEAEMREKDRLLQEKESALEEERKQREISDTLASEKLKWEEEQRNKEREESDQGRQERWLLMQRMQEMERDVDGLAQAKKEAKVLNKTKEIYAKRKVMEEKEKEMESWSSSLKTLPNVETMERKEPEAMDANMEEHLRSLSQRAEALQEEADVRHVGSPELIERVERLTLELAERIAIETYDVGEHLFEIMDDMHPVLRQSELRTRSRNSRPRDVADAKNTAAAAMSVARTRVRAALHLSKDGVLYWLLTLYGNVASLLQSLRRPELADYDTALSPRGRRERRGKRERGENPSDDDPNAIVASRDLVRVCSNQWTERRWPSESSGMLSEVRAAVEKAAEDEYWRRYSEAMSNVPGRHMSGERDASTTSVDEPDANRMFWQLLVSGRMLSYVFSSSFSFSLQQEN